MHLCRLLNIMERGDSGPCRVEGIGLGLQHRLTALFDLHCARGEAREEGLDTRRARTIAPASSGAFVSLIADPPARRYTTAAP
jgi:hypothetical protein